MIAALRGQLTFEENRGHWLRVIDSSIVDVFQLIDSNVCRKGLLVLDESANSDNPRILPLLLDSSLEICAEEFDNTALLAVIALWEKTLHFARHPLVLHDSEYEEKGNQSECK